MHSLSKTTSVSRFPRLDRLLLDTDVNAELEAYLVAVGFRVEMAFRVPGLDVRNDTAIAKYARKHRYIFVYHDQHADKTTRLELYSEVYSRGGKMIRIGGSPDQSPLTSLGKILVNREQWIEFFAQNSGEAVVHQKGVNFNDREYLVIKVQRPLDLGDMTVGARTRKGRRKLHLPKPAQMPLTPSAAGHEEEHQPT